MKRLGAGVLAGLTLVGTPAAATGSETRLVGTTELVSRATASDAGAGGFSASISRDGTRVLFVTEAALVPEDTNGISDLYLRDRAAGTTTLVSATPDGGTGGPNEFTNAGTISADGRWAAFTSQAQGLDPQLSTFVADQLEPAWRLYLRDLTTGVTRLVTDCTGEVCFPVTPGPSYEAFVSADGAYVAFTQDREPAVWSRDTGTVQALNAQPPSPEELMTSEDLPLHPVTSISGDGRLVAYDHVGEVRVTDRVDGTTTAAPDLGWEYGGMLSEDGSTLAFGRNTPEGTATIAALDLDTGTEENVDANGSAFPTALSSTGRYVVFASFSPSVIASDANAQADVFMRDRALKRTERVSLGRSGAELADPSYGGAVSADGRAVAFHTIADGVVPEDTNGNVDLYLRVTKEVPVDATPTPTREAPAGATTVVSSTEPARAAEAPQTLSSRPGTTTLRLRRSGNRVRVSGRVTAAPGCLPGFVTVLQRRPRTRRFGRPHRVTVRGSRWATTLRAPRGTRFRVVLPAASGCAAG